MVTPLASYLILALAFLTVCTFACIAAWFVKRLIGVLTEMLEVAEDFYLAYRDRERS
ncbi:MAG: hypothetical protein M0R37_12765 [Bacteroidales bacterium]|nr:hypothetical protein [Bacteroidales bacterium]